MEEVFIDTLSHNPLGVVFLCCIAGAGVCIPIVGQILKLINEHKARVEEEQEKKKEEIQEAERVHLRFLESMDRIEAIGNTVTRLNDDVGSLQKMKEDYYEYTEKTSGKVNELMESVRSVIEESNKGDDKIIEIAQQNTKALRENTESLEAVSKDVKDIGEQVKVIIDGDLDSFRLFLTQMNTKHLNGIPLTEEEKQELEIRFETYKKEGGNGWAEKTYKALTGK